MCGENIYMSLQPEAGEGLSRLTMRRKYADVWRVFVPPAHRLAADILGKPETPGWDTGH